MVPAAWLGERRTGESDRLHKKWRSGKSGVGWAKGRVCALGVLEESGGGLEGRLLFCHRAGDTVASGTGVKGLTQPRGTSETRSCWEHCSTLSACHTHLVMSATCTLRLHKWVHADTQRSQYKRHHIRNLLTKTKRGIKHSHDSLQTMCSHTSLGDVEMINANWKQGVCCVCHVHSAGWCVQWGMQTCFGFTVLMDAPGLSCTSTGQCMWVQISPMITGLDQ